MTKHSARDRAGLTLTVLGATAHHPGPGTATPGYLVEGFGSRILLDCGSGVVSRLWAYCDPADLDAVIISHLHFDHFADVLVLRYALDAAARSGRLARPVPLWCPREPAGVFALASYKKALAAGPIGPDLTVTVGGMALSFVTMGHPVETYGVAFRQVGSGGEAVPRDRYDPGAPLLFYTADTGWFEELPHLIGSPRILLVEASLPEDEVALGPVIGHLTVGEAARLGAITGAQQVLVTHYPPERDPRELLAEAREVGGERITVATEGLVIAWP